MSATRWTSRRVTIAEALENLFEHGIAFRFTAYDGSAAGPLDSPVCLHLRNERGLSYLLTAPGDLGVARAQVEAHGGGRAVRPPRSPRRWGCTRGASAACCGRWR